MFTQYYLHVPAKPVKFLVTNSSDFALQEDEDEDEDEDENTN